MTNESKAMEVQKQEIIDPQDLERTRDRRCFVPRADIFETDENIVIVADMPGVDKESIDIVLEKNILTINGFVDPDNFDDFSLEFEEFCQGDYQRSFKISNAIDRDKIAATIKDGVLNLRLAKTDAVQTKKITVKSG